MSTQAVKIQELWRMRQRWHRAEKSLILQGKAICRAWTAGDKESANDLFITASKGGTVDPSLELALLPFFKAITLFRTADGQDWGGRKQAEKTLSDLAKSLPVAAWIESTPGIALPSLAAIVGEAGDLCNYSTHSKLWRRMGMAPFVKNGIARSGKQWKVAGGLTADDWSEFGYSPARRSVMFVIEDSMAKAKGPYRYVYLARKEYLRQRAEANGLTVAPAAKIPAKRRTEFVSLGHIDQDAKRYMGKRLLRDLWRAWRRAVLVVPEGANQHMPAVEISDARKGEVSAGGQVPKGHRRVADTAIADAAIDAGEAILGVPGKANATVPPRKSKAPSGAVSANTSVPEGHVRRADTKIADAPQGATLATPPLPQGLARHASAEAANRTMPKGQSAAAASKNTKAPQGAGRAVRAAPPKATSLLPTTN